jgi:hypothetical protein
MQPSLLSDAARVRSARRMPAATVVVRTTVLSRLRSPCSGHLAASGLGSCCCLPNSCHEAYPVVGRQLDGRRRSFELGQPHHLASLCLRR